MKLGRDADAMVVHVESTDETDRLGRAIADLVVANTVIALTGNLGAGKTRLVRAFSIAMGVDSRAISSPTFVLIHEYQGRLPVYHFDAYRVGEPGAFEALGAEEYWEAGGVCLVEWADLVASLIPRDAWWLDVSLTGETRRSVRISGLPESEQGRLADSLGSAI